MQNAEVIDLLNRILRTLYRSLPMYLQGRRVWAGGEQLRLALQALVADQQYYVERIGQIIYRLDGRIETGQFPLDFTSINDVSLEWLWNTVIDHQSRDVAVLEACFKALADAPEVAPLAEEVLGNARGHLQTLDELVGVAEMTRKSP